MRKLLGLVVLAACELQPAPKKQPAPPPPPQGSTAKPVESPPAPPAAGSAARPEISEPCMEVATKVAQVLVDSATDAGQKSIYERERANMTRRTGEACTAQGWSEAARTCYLATKTPVDIKACETTFSPPPPPEPAQPPTEG